MTNYVKHLLQQKSTRLIGLVAFSIGFGAVACNFPGGRTEVGEVPTTTPFVVFVTATPDDQPPIGGVVPNFDPDGFVEPTLDLSDVTSFPTPSGPSTPTATFIPTATPDEGGPAATPTPTVTPFVPDDDVIPTEPQSQSGEDLPPPAPVRVSGEAVRASNLGVNFISSAQHSIDNNRIRAGLSTGAGWDRFAIYWNEIETEPGEWDWKIYDETVQFDVVNDLNTNAILLGTPKFRGDARGVPNGLFEPVFDDGTDIPGSGKGINEDNPWAVFVNEAVERYQPGGQLARLNDWERGQGVTVWEIWNEPDFTMFWLGTVEEYARMLEVGYAAIKQADSDADVMVGGLVLFEKPAFFQQMLDIYKADPSPVPGRYPFDKVAIHSYSNPTFTFASLQRTEALLGVYGLNDREIWVNESGVAVWDDYPGPTWATRPDQIVFRATQEEQANYIVQNAAYAFIAGAEVLFHFQLFDDCGNQPAGADFPIHDGSVCANNPVCWGDALGLYRNDNDNVCFTQHPNPGTPRPAFDAYNTVVDIFSAADITPLQMFTVGTQRWLVFARPDSAELIILLWNESGQGSEARVIARSEEAVLVSRDGARETIEPDDEGFYNAFLPPATNRNSNDGRYMIGGEPVILIQQTDEPFVSVLPILNPTRNAFLVKWRGNRDDLTDYEVWYQDVTSSSTEWIRWLEADRPGEALFVGESGRQYAFFARAKDKEDNWTLEEPVRQTFTTVQ